MIFRKSNEETLKQVIEQLLDTYKLREKLNHVRLLRSWETIMGEAIAKRTEKIYLKDDVLTIHLTSAPLKEELHYGREKIKALLNKELEGDFIKDVVIR
jgi:Dna[CI] antecedent, DciA